MFVGTETLGQIQNTPLVIDVIMEVQICIKVRVLIMEIPSLGELRYLDRQLHPGLI